METITLFRVAKSADGVTWERDDYTLATLLCYKDLPCPPDSYSEPELGNVGQDEYFAFTPEQLARRLEQQKLVWSQIQHLLWRLEYPKRHVRAGRTQSVFRINVDLEEEDACD